MKRSGWSAAVAWLLLVAPGIAQVAHAQDGLELTMDAGHAYRGKAWLLRGQVFRVSGLATLAAAPGATLRAQLLDEDRPVGEPASVRAGAEGAYLLRVPIPVDAPSTVTVRLELEAGALRRTLEHALSTRHPERLALRTDRRFYHRGERAHAWALLRDERTLQPIAGRSVRFVLEGPMGRRPVVVRTDTSGVAHHVFRLPDAAGRASLEAQVVDPMEGVRAQTNIEIGQRAMERMLLELDWPEAQVQPSGTFHPTVRVVAPSGEPARGAAVTLTVEGMEPVTGRTDGGGLWSAPVTAPAYLANATGTVTVSVVVSHPAIGSASRSKTLQLQGSGGYAIHAHVAGALAFDFDTPVYFSLRSSGGERAPAGISFTVRTPMVRGGEVELTTDAHGLASTTFRAVPMRAVPDLCGPLGVPFEVEDAQERTRELCLQAARADVALRAEEAVREPGQPLTITLRRHPRVAGRPVVLSLHAPTTGEVLAVKTLGPRQRRARFETPAVLGTLTAVGRPLLDEGEGRSAEGIESTTAVLVRPADPAFVEAEPTESSYPIGATAGVRIRTGAEPGWVAVNVRDLAQHGGEVPFRLAPLRGAFDRALLDPGTEDADRLLRAALAARASGPRPPQRARDATYGPGPGRSATEGTPNLLRDPVLAARLAARGTKHAMRLLEAALRERGAEALTTGAGARRRFDPEVVDPLLDAQQQRALGDRPLRLAHLQEADPGFGFPLAARRLARERLIRALQQLVQGIASGQVDGDRPERWVSDMVRQLGLDPAAVRDPWGGPLGARPRPDAVVAPSPEAPSWTLAFPGPDGRLGTRDDVVDPFARVVPRGTLYADASGEEELLAALSMIVPVSATLQGWVEVLSKVTAAMEATLRGDAVSAEAIGESFGFGGLGLRGVGRGGGGGHGSGFGRGRGSRTPRIRTGNASVSDDLRELAGRVRVDFPGTLLFVPSQPTGDGGLTEVPIPLADAATTYLVEVIHWRGDGWSHSAQTRFQTQKPLIVEAPLPSVAHVGETMEVPVRVRSREATIVELGLVAEGDLDLAIGDAQRVTVEAGGAAVAYVSVEVRGPGSGSLVAVAAGGEHRDAIRMPLQTFRQVRRVSRTDDRLLTGDTTLLFGATEHEPDAWALSPSRVRLTSADRLFRVNDGNDWTPLARALAGQADARAAGDEGWGFAAGWGDPAYSDERARRALIAVSELLGDGGSPVERATKLIYLAGAWRAREARATLREDLERLRENLLAAVERDATETSDDPLLHALAAYAFALHGDRAMATELARRARRELVRFEDQAWLPSTRHLDTRGASAALGLADAELGEREEAFVILRTIADQRRLEPPGWRGGHERGSGLAQLLALRLGGGALDRVAVTLAGETTTLALRDGEGGFTAKLRRGRGVVPVQVPAGHVTVARVRSELALPWPAQTETDGPLRVSVTTETARLDGSMEATLTVRNAVPRSIRQPQLTVTLPAGAVLDERARRTLNARLAAPVVVEAGRLRLTPRALLPGLEVELPITLRYELGGELSGFGVDAWSADRPDRRTVVPPTTIEVNR